MSEAPPGLPPHDDRPLGLASALDEDVQWQGLMSAVHRSIERRETSAQAVEFSVEALAGVLVEYLKAIVAAFSESGRRNRAD